MPPSIPISTNVEDLTRRVEWLQGEVERLSAVIKGWTRGGFTNPVFRYMQAESVSFRFLASEGDIIYRDTRGRLTRLALGTSGQLLQSSGGIPTWVNSSAAIPTT